MMTYKEIEAKYNLDEQYVSNAVINHKLQPKGRVRNGNGRLVNTWDEAEVIKAVAALFNKKAVNHIERANAWSAEAERLLAEMGEAV